jgi:tetratricopeptide (TPR) repeat protein
VDAGIALERNRESSAAIERFREAEQECRAAEQLEPENGDVHLNLSYLFGRQQKWDEATRAARKAVSLNPRSANAHVCLGVALREGAPSFLRALIDEIWKQAEEGVSLGATEIADIVGLSSQEDLEKNRKANLDEAIAEFRTALHLNPNDDMAHYNLGFTLVMADNPDGGIAEYREALRLNPENAFAHNGLGSVFGNKGDLDAAIAETRAAILLDPVNPQYHFNLARWLERKGDREETLGEYRTAYTLDPQNLGFKGAYEGFLQKVNAARQLEKLQHWLGTWVFAGPLKFAAGCGGRTFPLLDRDVPDYSFKVLTISPSGEVAARVEHPRRADESAKPGWSGTATDTTLVLTMDPIPPGTALLGSRKLKGAVGRLEAHREGDRYSVEFTYFNSWASLPKQGCSDYYQEYKRFLGEMRRP